MAHGREQTREERVLGGNLWPHATHLVSRELGALRIQVRQNEVDRAALADAGAAVDERAAEEHEQALVDEFEWP